MIQKMNTSDWIQIVIAFLQLIVVIILSRTLNLERKKHEEDREEKQRKTDLKYLVSTFYSNQNTQLLKPTQIAKIISDENSGISEKDVRLAIYDTVADGVMELNQSFLLVVKRN